MKRNIILLVDADADLVGALLELTGQTGHGVRLARTTTEAFRILNSDIEHVDLIVVDLESGTDGLELLEAISGCHRRAPLIVVTAPGEPEMTHIAEQHGASACLGKPVSVDQLRSTVDEVPRSEDQQKILFCDLWGHLHDEPYLESLRRSQPDVLVTK